MTSFRELSSGLEVKTKFFKKDSVPYSICYSHLSSILGGGSNGKASAYSVGDPGLIPGLGRSSGEGNGNPLQYFCLENPMDREHGKLQSVGLQRVGYD